MNAQNLRLAIQTPDGYQICSVKDLIYCVAEGNYSWLYLTDGRKFLLSKSLGVLERRLPEEFFIRIHNRYLTNKLHIVQYTNGEVNCVRMSNGEELEVSRRNQQRLKEQFLMI